MFKLFKHSNKVDIFAPGKGRLKPLTEVEDAVFSKGLVGPGFAIEPSDDTVFAPVKGTVKMIFPTKHALGIQTINGLDFILHIGIDTVNLKGEGFTVLVKENQLIEPGLPLVKVDYALIKERGYSTDLLCVATNIAKMDMVENMHSYVDVEKRVAVCEKQ